MNGGTTTKAGVVLVVAGALLMAGPAFGFSTLAADRGVNVGAAATDSALLAIEETGETPDNQNDAVVINITNNANERFDPLAAQAEIVEDSNGALAIGDGFDTTLDPGATMGLELTCSGGGSGTATVEVTADAVGSSLSVEGVTYSHTFSYSCTGGGGPPSDVGFESVSAGDIIGPSPTTQELTFTLDGKLGNGESVTIDLVGLIANYDGANVETSTIGGKPTNQVEFEPAGESATITVTAKGNIKPGEEVRIVLDDVGIGFWAWQGLATFSTSTNQANDGFQIDAGSASMSTASTDDGSLTDRDGTITREELESVPIDELERFDTYDELEAYIESEMGIDVVEDEG